MDRRRTEQTPQRAREEALDSRDRIASVLQNGYSQDEVREAISGLVDMNRGRGIG